jgi:hypothetical protein
VELGSKPYTATIHFYEEPEHAGLILESLEINGKEIPRNEWGQWLKFQAGALVFFKE